MVEGQHIRHRAAAASPFADGGFGIADKKGVVARKHGKGFRASGVDVLCGADRGGVCHFDDTVPPACLRGGDPNNHLGTMKEKRGVFHAEDYLAVNRRLARRYHTRKPGRLPPTLSLSTMSNPAPVAAPLTLDLYDTTDGPTLRIGVLFCENTGVDDAAGLGTLCRLFGEIADRPGQALDLLPALRQAHPVTVAGVGGVSLVCRLRPRLLDPSGGDWQGDTLVWWATPDKWRTFADQTQALMERGGPGHQYLDAGAVTVEVAYRE